LSLKIEVDGEDLVVLPVTEWLDWYSKSPLLPCKACKLSPDIENITT